LLLNHNYYYYDIMSLYEVYYKKEMCKKSNDNYFCQIYNNEKKCEILSQIIAQITVREIKSNLLLFYLTLVHTYWSNKL